ncbi:DUF2752 domain-containing protein [Flavobacterium gelidilacus]|jgi:hypothetical protein
MEEYMVPCMNKSIFGIDCMGCGTQRSLALLLDGEFIEAFKMFPAIYTLLLFGLTITLHLLDKKRNYLTPIAVLAVANGVIMVVNYFYKIYIN